MMMPKSPKRKRRHSRDLTKTHMNPFLVVSSQSQPPPEDNDDDGDGDENARILRWMLTFVDHSKPNASPSHDDVDDGNNSDTVFRESVVGLVRVLEETEEREHAEDDATAAAGIGGHGDSSNRNNSNNNKRPREASGYASEIARLLFPWALQQVNKILDGNTEIVVAECHCWSAFRFALSRFFTQGETPPLTQSVLFKMVPRLTQLACDRGASKLSRDQAAEVFCVLLVHELFTPTLDVAVETVLLPLVRALQLADTYSSRRVLPDSSLSSLKGSNAMLLTTLQWIHTRLVHHGNPKSNFGVVARKPVLLAISRIHLLWQTLPDGRLLSEIDYDNDRVNRRVIHKIIYDGLVAPQHHMDGFKSLSVSATFSCYQNDLLQTIAATLRDTSVPGDVRDMAWFLPVLLHNFLEASRVWYHEQPDKYKKKAPPLSALQFAVFERLAGPLLQAMEGPDIDASGMTVGLRALREMHDLVDKFQAYVPAHDSKDQPQFTFLQRVANFLLERHVDPGNFLGLEQYADTILLTTRLVQLNHLLWREKWQAVLRHSLCSSDARLTHLISTMWRVATETFTQLRQVDDWVQILVNVSASLDDESRSEVLADILKATSVEKALAEHIQSCPVTQIPPVFSSLQQALRCPDHTVLSTVMRPLVVTVLRSFKVDPGTVDTVSSSLQVFMKGTVDELVGSDSLAVRNVSIEASGWCIDLSMRCAFWLGPSAQAQVPTQVQNAMETNVQGDELLLVTAHRLRQLSSLIHEARLSQLRHESLSTKEVEELEKEAERLATHLYTKARSMLTEEGWILIARFLQFWIPYAKQNQVDDFLGWVSVVLSLTSSMDHVPACFIVPPAGDVARQKEFAQSLLQDEAFHDLGIISERFPYAAAKVTAQWIVLSLSGNSDTEVREADQYLFDADEIMELNRSDFSSAWDAVAFDEDDFSAADRDSAERRLCCAMEIVRILNSLPSKGQGQFRDIALPLLYLDKVICEKYLNNLDARFYVTAVSLSGCLRKALHNDLELDDEAIISSTLKFLQESLGRCSLSNSSGGPNEEDQVYFHLSGKLVDELCGATYQSCENGDLMLNEWFKNLLSPQQKLGADNKPNFDVGAVDSFLILHTLQGLAGSKSANTKILEYSDRVVKTYTQLFDMGSAASWASIIMCKIIVEALLLSECHGGSQEHAEVREELVDVCLRWLRRGHDSETCLEILLSLLALESPLPGGRLSQILQTVILLERGQVMIPPIVCSCIRQMSSDAFDKLIEDLVRLERKGLSTRLLVARLMFSEALLPADHGVVLTGDKDRLLDFALHSLQQVDDHTPDTAPAAVEVWIQAVQNGHSIKSEKLVVLLGRVAQALGPGERSTCLYTSCARLLALLLQRYSKHLSVCVPVVVLVLQSFLRQLIDYKLSTEDLSLRGRYWTRLCELLVPQKDVYKKHLVHVVLESLRAAENGEVKQALMPGWMHLLDTFSPSYEIRQLNALMEDTSIKMSFRPIYEQYRRHHAYQGH